MLLADCSAMELVAIRMIEKRWKCLKLVLNFKMFHVITFKKMIFILLLINFEAIFDLGNIFLGIDNFSQFGNISNELYENFNKFKGKNSHFIENDCFQLNLNLDYTFNVFFFDGDHTLEAHTKSLVYFYDFLDNEFVFIVDDWNIDLELKSRIDPARVVKFDLAIPKL